MLVCDVVLDVGKTHAKLTLWDRAGRRLARRVRRNANVQATHYLALDVAGIEHWLTTILAEFAELGSIRHIVPVAHGAAAAIVADESLICPPLDYEQPLPPELQRRYAALRDPFTATGSPALPLGLNLGAQLFWLEALHPELWSGHPDARIVPWPQYWAWVLSGIAAAEVTSLGSHTDLWQPFVHAPSPLAVRRGWAQRLATLRHASEVLGPLRPEWAARTHLPSDTRIVCGLHDSNAALLAARAFHEIDRFDATVVSTGTWFVAMRSCAQPACATLPAESEHRDCLMNVDVFGQPVPSARFMGGREIELLLQTGDCPIEAPAEQQALLDAAEVAVRAGSAILPTGVPGVGPYPHARGGWIGAPATAHQRSAAIALYIALLTDASLDLIGARERIMLEGRFASAEVFTRALAALRPGTAVFVSSAQDGIDCGALQLLDPAPFPFESLRRVEPLAIDLAAYRAAWRAAAQRVA